MNRLGQHRTSILQFQGTFPKTLWGFTKAKPPWLPEGRKCPDCVFLECTVITREEEGLEALWDSDQQFPNSLYTTIVFWLPKWCTVPTLLLQNTYSWLEMSPTFSGRALWGKWLRICQGGQCSQGKPLDQIQQGLDQAREMPHPSGAGLWQSSIVAANFPRDFR